MKSGKRSLRGLTEPDSERILSFQQKFTDEYGAYIESLSDEKVFEILGVIEDPKFGWMLSELRKRRTKSTLRER